jgi:hypothetical protein
MGLQQSRRLNFHTVLCDSGPPARVANQVGGIVAGDILKVAPMSVGEIAKRLGVSRTTSCGSFPGARRSQVEMA